MKKIVENIGLAAWELSLLPTKVGLEMEANKILREKKKAEKTAQKNSNKGVEKMVDKSVEDESIKKAEETMKEETQENPNQDGNIGQKETKECTVEQKKEDKNKFYQNYLKQIFSAITAYRNMDNLEIA